jgi:hypothetical protein
VNTRLARDHSQRSEESTTPVRPRPAATTPMFDGLRRFAEKEKAASRRLDTEQSVSSGFTPSVEAKTSEANSQQGEDSRLRYRCELCECA